MSATNVKQEAQRLVETLPDNASWEDLMHRIYVREAVEKGLEDSRAGRTVEVGDVRQRFGLPR